MRVVVLLSAWAAVGALTVSCRSAVDAGPENDRAVAAIREATGAARTFHPDDDAGSIAAHVAALLDDGLTLEEAVEFGLLNNPRMQAAHGTLGMAHADRVQAGLFTNPSLGALFRVPASGGSTEVEASLFAGLLEIWQVPERERVAGLAFERQLIELTGQAVVLAAQIRMAFIDTAFARKGAEIAEEDCLVASRLVELAEARQQAAAATILDVNLARLEEASTRSALRDAELAVDEISRRLCLLLGLAPGHELRLEPLVEWSLAALPSRATLECAAKHRRFDLRAASVALAAAEAELERQRDRTWRDLDVGLAAERDDGGWSIGPGIRLELPLFDQNQAQVARAEQDVQRAMALLAATSLEASHDVHSAEARLRGALSALELHRNEVLRLSEETLEQASVSYRAGKTAILPVIEAQQRWLAARQETLRRQHQFAVALSELDRATGTPRSAWAFGPGEGDLTP